MPRIAYAVTGALAASILVWWVAKRSLRAELTKGSETLNKQLTAGGATLEQRLARGEREVRVLIKDQVTATVPPLVQREIRTTLADYGVTPQLSLQITRLLQAASSAGLLGLQR